MTGSTQVGAGPGGSGSADEDGRRRRIRAVTDLDRGPTPVAGWESSADDGRPRIVVVDADPQVARTVAAVLGPVGATVQAAPGPAADALRLVDRFRPDLVMLEVGRPGATADPSPSDGSRLAAEMHRRRLAPVLLLLPADADSGSDPIGDSGAVGCLSKPLRSDALPAAVEIALARAAGLTALREQVSDITGRLRDREVLERAKGLLMVHRGLSEPQAFRWLQRTAMDRRSPMTTVAAAIIDRYATAVHARSGAVASGTSARPNGVPAPVLPPGRHPQDRRVRPTAVGQ